MFIENRRFVRGDFPPPTFFTKESAKQAAIAYLGTGIHECGHAIAAWTFYQDANPKISFSWLGGHCTYSASRLNSWGLALGESNARAAIAAAGPFTDLIVLLGITKQSRSDRNVARLIFPKALGLSLYALSGVVADRPSHDFAAVWKEAGGFAYGLLAAASLATTALIYRNATAPSKKLY